MDLFSMTATIHAIHTIMADVLGVDVKTIRNDQLLGRDLGADSLDYVAIAQGIEEWFGVKNLDDRMDRDWRVLDLIAAVDAEINPSRLRRRPFNYGQRA